MVGSVNRSNGWFEDIFFHKAPEVDGGLIGRAIFSCRRLCIGDTYRPDLKAIKN